MFIQEGDIGFRAPHFFYAAVSGLTLSLVAPKTAQAGAPFQQLSLLSSITNRASTGCEPIKDATGIEAMTQAYRCLYGMQNSTADLNTICASSCEATRAQCLREMQAQLTQRVVMFEGCDIEELDANDTTYHALMNSIREDTQPNPDGSIPTEKGTATFIGDSCQVLLTAAHNFWDEKTKEIGEKIFIGDGGRQTYVEIDRERSYFASKNRAERDADPKQDFAIIVLKEPKSNCQWFDYAVLSENEIKAAESLIVNLAFAIPVNDDTTRIATLRAACGGTKDKSKFLNPNSISRLQKEIIVNDRSSYQGFSGGPTTFIHPDLPRPVVVGVEIGTINDKRPTRERPLGTRERDSKFAYGPVNPAENAERQVPIINFGRTLESDLNRELLARLRLFDPSYGPVDLKPLIQAPNSQDL